MTVSELNEIIKKSQQPATEHQLQVDCKQWFDKQYPELVRLLYHVPNGEYRCARTGARLKKAGVVKGVSDFILQIPNTDYNVLNVELKLNKRTSKQSPEQKAFQADAEKAGAKYAICRSLEEFQSTVKEYLKTAKTL